LCSKWVYFFFFLKEKTPTPPLIGGVLKPSTWLQGFLGEKKKKFPPPPPPNHTSHSACSQSIY